MDSPNSNIMIQPNPNDHTDYTSVATVLGAVSLVLLGFIAWIGAYFKNKAQERQDFIQSITDKRVDDRLKSFKDDFKIEFHDFKVALECQVKEMNRIVIEILKETKKC